MRSTFQKFQKVPLIVSILFMLGGITLFIFLRWETQQNTKMTAAAQIEWQDEAKKRGEIKSLERGLNSVSVESALLEAHFIHSGDVVPFLDMIEKLGPEAGAKAELALVDLFKDNSGLIVEVKVNGTFASVYKFLSLLENSPYQLDILAMDMQRVGGELSGEKKDSQLGWQFLELDSLTLHPNPMNLNFLKTKKKFKKGGLHVNPNVYWNVLLTVMFGIIIASFAYGFFFFRAMNLEFNLNVPEGNSQAETINKQRMDKVLGYFLARDEKSKSVIANPAPVVDPSL